MNLWNTLNGNKYLENFYEILMFSKLRIIMGKQIICSDILMSEIEIPYLEMK